jgi:osmotically-inducible protein OsmY
MNTLEQNITDALASNPHVHSDEISVYVLGGDVTLIGTVGSVVEREEAVRTTRHVTGVQGVTNRLRLGVSGASDHADADTEAVVLDTLNADAAVPASNIAVAVRDGAVTLSGLVDLVSQRDLAERDALAVPGVASVHNRLRVAFPVSAVDVAERIADPIGLDSIIGADSLNVTVSGVTLSVATPPEIVDEPLD